MSTSPHWSPPAPRDAGDDLEFDLLVDESRGLGSAAWQPAEGPISWTPGSDDADRFDQRSGSHPATSTDYLATAGTPGRGVIVSTALASAAVAVLDLAIVGRLSIFFDLCFVVVCLVAAMAVRARDLFTAAVLPPLAFGGTIACVALVWPDAITPNLSFASTVLAGLAMHAMGLIFGYGAALLTVGARVYARRRT